MNVISVDLDFLEDILDSIGHKHWCSFSGCKCGQAAKSRELRNKVSKMVRDLRNGKTN